MDGVPDYLARHYWWAYLWRGGVWFFDHQPIINLILFGQYRRLMTATLERLKSTPMGRVLQLTAVYGELTPKLAACLPDDASLHLADVALVQLKLAQRKTEQLHCVRLNAEQLAYRDGQFDTVVLFFLLHEMPPEARRNVLAEVIRVVAPGGRLLLTEYGPAPLNHPLYRFAPFRWLLGRLEPFLPSFWQEDLPALLTNLAACRGVHLVGQTDIFGGFYRVSEFRF